ncbi:DUF3421 domain-containing protein [Jiella marina]|uniref:DUF3421 domain-containing protein n=1 Tax=Jiella sp. LLJ827 TaxID=2917712 RepID=UPI002101AA5B|nr:DUF3421 domain-containing protein [Jiella sp. LLJ827]
MRAFLESASDREGHGGGRGQPAPSANYRPPSPASTGVGWADQSGGAIDREAMPVGHEANGETLYACTAAFNNGNHPGKLRPAFGGCVIGYGGREYTVRQYSTLLGQGRWITASSQYQLPEGAYDGGNEANDSPLYVCRAPFNGGLHPGKVGPSTGGCNVTYGGVEHTIYQFEVLVP